MSFEAGTSIQPNKPLPGQEPARKRFIPRRPDKNAEAKTEAQPLKAPPLRPDKRAEASAEDQERMAKVMETYEGLEERLRSSILMESQDIQDAKRKTDTLSALSLGEAKFYDSGEEKKRIVPPRRGEARPSESKSEARTRPGQGIGSTTYRFNYVYRKYDGEEVELTGYDKPRDLENRFMYDPDSKESFILMRKRLPGGKFAESRQEIDDEGLANNVREVYSGRESMRKECAPYYGLQPENIKFGKEVTLKNSVDAGQSSINEAAYSLASERLKLGCIPLTVLRREADGGGIKSVQEGITSSDKANPVRDLSREDYSELMKQGPKHPGARSFMRLAVTDYLLPSLDRHSENIKYDPAKKQFFGIDSSYSFPLHKGETDVTDENGEKSKIPVPVDQLVSLPLEAVEKHPDWKLDEEALANFKKIHEDFTNNGENGEEYKNMREIFSMVYKHDKIVDKETKNFFDKLGYLVKHGRPPNLLQNGILKEKSAENFPMLGMEDQMTEGMKEQLRAAGYKV